MHVVEVEIDARLVEIGDARVADRGQDAAEVRVAGEERRLDQRRMGDRVGDLAAFLDARGRLRRAMVMNLVAPSPSRTIAWASSARDVCNARRAARGRRRCPAIVTRRVCRGRWRSARSESLVDVSPSTVTRLNDASATSRASCRSSAGVDRRIGRDEAEHGRHVRVDHARALAMPVTRDRRAVDAHAAAKAFGTVSVVMIASAAVSQSSSRRPQRVRQPGDDPLDRQRLHDHAGRERQDLFGHAVDELRGPDAGRACCRESRLASARICVARIDDERSKADAPFALGQEMLPAYGDRRRAKAILGETPPATVPGVANDHQQVVAIPVLDLRRRRAERNAGDGEQRISGRRRVVDGHAASRWSWARWSECAHGRIVGLSGKRREQARMRDASARAARRPPWYIWRSRRG